MLKLLSVFLIFSCVLVCPVLLKAQPGDPSTDSMLKALPKTKEDTARVILLVEIATNLSFYDPGKALGYALEAASLSKKLNYRFGMARSAYICGNIYLYQGNYKTSAAALDEAEAIYESLGRKDKLGMVYNARGNWYYMQSDLRNASASFTKSAEIFSALKDTAKEMIAFGNIISIQGEIRNYQKAISLSRNLLAMARARKDSLQIAYTLHHLIINYMAIDSTGSANNYIPELSAFIENTLDYNLAADSYHLIGDYYSKINDDDSALLLYKKALDKSLRNNYQPASYNFAIGKTYLVKNRLDSAFSYLSKAAALAKQANSMDVYYHICQQISLYYERTGNFTKAYQYLQEYTKLNDSIIVEETRRYSAQLEAMYESNKKETEIIRLKNIELEKNIALRNRSNYLYTAGGIMLLLGTMFYFRTKNYRTKEKLLQKEKVLQQEQIKFLEKQQQVVSLQSMINGQETERTRIAKDLHDGLGGLFSTIKMYFSSLLHERQELKSSEVFSKSYSLIDTASDEVRRIAHNMMPEVLIKLGLVQAIQDLCSNISAGKIIQVQLQAYGMDKRLATSTEIMLYRIIQELLNNIMKHAHATEAILQFNNDGHRLMVTVEDNGRGFDMFEKNEEKHAGLDTIRSRVHYLNGNISIESHKETGTTVMMEFLLNDNIAGKN